jgi:hypothetical protein
LVGCSTGAECAVTCGEALTTGIDCGDGFISCVGC